MIGFWNPLFAAIRSFLLMWRQALLEELPAGFRNRLKLITEPASIELETTDELYLQLQNAEKDREVRVFLGGDLILRKTLMLPKEASHDIKNVVLLEAERLMPIDPKQLVIAHRIGAMAGSKQISVELAVTRKSTIGAILQDSHRSGRQLTAIYATGTKQSAEIEFPIPQLARRRVARGGLIVVAACSAFALLTFAPSIYLGRLDEQSLLLDEEIRQARHATETIAGLQRQVREMENLGTSVQEVDREAMLLDLLKTLTVVSPDDVSLESLRIEGRRIFVSGNAATPENWVIDLERTAAFENVVLTSVRTDEHNQRRKFDIRMTIIWPAQREEGGI